MSLPSLKDFYLVGGTALSLLYGHRISIDLDLFSASMPDTDRILTELKGISHSVDSKLTKPQSTLLLEIEDVKVDIIRHNYPLLRPILELDGIRLLDPVDIAAMKIGAITARGSKKDFIDLYFLLQHFSLQEILTYHKTKYAQNEMFFILKSLIWFDDANMESNLTMLSPISWIEVKERIKEEVGKL